MPTPEDRNFFEALNKDLADSLGKSLKDGLKQTKFIDQEGAELIGTAVTKGMKGVEAGIKELNRRSAQTGGGGPEGEAAGGVKDKLFGFAKDLLGSTKQLVDQNATNVIAFGDTIARSSVATSNQFLQSTQQLTTNFGRWGHDLRAVGQMLDSAMRSNVRNLGRNTQNFLARTTGLGTSLGEVNKFLATQANVLGGNQDAILATGKFMQDVALSNGILADSVFQAVNAFTETSRKQSVLFGSQMPEEFKKILAGMVGLAPGLDVNSLLAKIAPTSVEGLINLDILSGRLGGGFGSDMLATSPKRHTAEFISRLASFGATLKTMNPRQAAQMVEGQFGKLGIGLTDIQAAMRLMAEAGSQAALAAAFAGPTGVPTDTEMMREMGGVSVEFTNSMKNFAIEMNAGTLFFEKFQATAYDAISNMFYGPDGATTQVAKSLGMAAAGVASLQGIQTYSNGAAGALFKLALAATAATFAMIPKPGKLPFTKPPGTAKPPVVAPGQKGFKAALDAKGKPFVPQGQTVKIGDKTYKGGQKLPADMFDDAGRAITGGAGRSGLATAGRLAGRALPVVAAGADAYLTYDEKLQEGYTSGEAAAISGARVGAGSLAAGGMAVKAAPLLAGGPLGWLAYAALTGGAYFLGSELAEAGAETVIDYTGTETGNAPETATSAYTDTTDDYLQQFSDMQSEGMDFHNENLELNAEAVVLLRQIATSLNMQNNNPNLNAGK